MTAIAALSPWRKPAFMMRRSPPLRGGVARRDRVEQALDDAFVADLGDHLTAGVQVAALAERDELLDDRTQVLRLRQRRDDLLVLDQRDGKVGEHRTAMACTAAEPAAGNPWRMAFSFNSWFEAWPR